MRRPDLCLGKPGSSVFPLPGYTRGWAARRGPDSVRRVHSSASCVMTRPRVPTAQRLLRLTLPEIRVHRPRTSRTGTVVRTRRQFRRNSRGHRQPAVGAPRGWVFASFENDGSSTYGEQFCRSIYGFLIPVSRVRRSVVAAIRQHAARQAETPALPGPETSLLSDVEATRSA